MPSPSEQAFNRQMVELNQRLKTEIDYRPIRFMQMVGELGGVAAAKRLLAGRDASDGFTTLWEHNRLGMSIEATVLLPWYAELFTDAELAIGRNRLLAYGFDVDNFLKVQTTSPPGWFTMED